MWLIVHSLSVSLHGRGESHARQYLLYAHNFTLSTWSVKRTSPLGQLDCAEFAQKLTNLPLIHDL
jgi:hypothetical protein